MLPALRALASGSRGTSHLRCAGFEPDAAYVWAVKVLRVGVVSRAPFEPPAASPLLAVQQAARLQSSAYRLGWHGGDKVAFMESAAVLPHPVQVMEDDLPQDLVEAVRFVVRKGESIVDWRAARVQLLRDVAAALQPLNGRMVATMRPSVAHVAGQYNVAFMAAMAEAMRHPDVFIVRDFVRGFQTYGELPSSGVYHGGGSGPELPVQAVLTQASNARWNIFLQASMHARHTAAMRLRAAGKPDAMSSIEAAWSSTVDECKDGWMIGVWDDAAGEYRGFTADELDRHPWLFGRGSWRGLRRFAIWQKAKWRPIDDGAENLLNAVTGTWDKLSLIGADFPAKLVRLFQCEIDRRAAEMGVPPPLWVYEGSSDDVLKAYRRVPASDVGMTVASLPHPVSGEAQFFLVPGFPFGLVSAVMQWNRYAALVVSAMRRLLAATGGGYYDDFHFGEPAWARGSAQAATGQMLELVGLGFAAPKHVAPDQIFPFLGVESDCSRMPITGAIEVGVSASQREHMDADVRRVLAEGVLSRGAAGKLYSRMRWTLCPVFGRVGVAALQPLRDRADAPPDVQAYILSEDLRECLLFLLRVLQLGLRTQVPVRPVREWPTVVLTDAEGHGGIGIVVRTPCGQLFYAFGVAPPWIMELFASFRAGRALHHFVDNQPALSGLVKGSSGLPDSARIIHAYHVEVLRLACRPWLGFVYSEDNLSDDPSRGRFGRLLGLGARERDCMFPTDLDWHI